MDQYLPVTWHQYKYLLTTKENGQILNDTQTYKQIRRQGNRQVKRDDDEDKNNSRKGIGVSLRRPRPNSQAKPGS